MLLAGTGLTRSFQGVLLEDAGNERFELATVEFLVRGQLQLCRELDRFECRDRSRVQLHFSSLEARAIYANLAEGAGFNGDRTDQAADVERVTGFFGIAFDTFYTEDVNFHDGLRVVEKMVDIYHMATIYQLAETCKLVTTSPPCAKGVPAMKTQELVEEVLKKQNVTPYRLAKEMGVENPTVYRWKNGQREANGKHLMELLRRAGKLAAGILLGVAVGGVAAPGEVQAGQESMQEQCALSTHYTHLRMALPEVNATLTAQVAGTF